MTVYVALLRGVNLLGVSTLKMADLKAIAAKLNLKDARTYIASGNLLFTSGKAEEPLRRALEKEIKDLKDKWDNVKNDFFKNRVNEWIEEKKEKVESTYKEIESVREKINFLNEQMKRN